MYRSLKKKASNSYVNRAYPQINSFILVLPLTHSKKDLNSRIIVSHSSATQLYNLFDSKVLKLPLIIKILNADDIPYQSLSNDSVILVFNNFYVLDFIKAERYLNLQSVFSVISKIFQPIIQFYTLEIFLFF